jgi:DmsE family decaheme c-type cytochrome
VPARFPKPLARFVVPAVVLTVLAGLALVLGAAPRQQARPSDDAETCGACHEDIVKAAAAGPHSALKGKTCTACHGSAEKHIEEEGKGGVFAFRGADPPADKSARCQACHQKDNPGFALSPHAKAALDCTSCHSVHGETVSAALLRTDVNKNCSICHQEVLAQFQLSERHRLQEGAMTCVTCHDPHEPAARVRLGGFKQEACLKCHPDKGGPFIYEHPASRVEGCTVCHEPHGSTNRHLLVQQSVADQCFSCHAEAPAWHANFTSAGTNCVTCHSAIHGSNLSPRFLK